MKARNIFFLVAAVGFAAFLGGCQQAPAPLNPNAFLAPPLPDTDVSNFQNASLKVNPSLLDQNQGIFLDGSYGFKTDSGLVLAAPPAGSAPYTYTGGSAYALHLFGNYIDYNNLGYPAFELECFPRANASYQSGNMYDITPFSGVSFWWNRGMDDNANQIFFCLVTARIAPQSIGGDGTCGASTVPCYDYLAGDLSGYPEGEWFQVYEDFAPMKTQYGGHPITVADYSQVLQLMWTSRSNNNNNTNPSGPAQNYTADFWVDDIQFYP